MCAVDREVVNAAWALLEAIDAEEGAWYALGSEGPERLRRALLALEAED